MTHKHTSLLYIALTGLAISITYLLAHTHTTTLLANVPLPDVYMEEVVATFLDKQGRPSMRVITPKLVHYAENDTTQLTDPQLALYHKSPRPWYINAKYAKATHGIEHVQFWQDVTIHHVADENNPATLIKTPTLTVRPEQQTAETPDLITLVQSNITVNAQGMYADLDNGNIKLLSHSKGEYVPSW